MNQIPFIQAKGEGSIEIQIDDEIGFWGVTAQDVISKIKESGAKNIELRINSVGGSVTDALSIYNYLKDSKAIVTAKVDGLAASAATIIAQSANKGRRYTAESAMWMVHEASMMAYGKKADIEEQIQALDVANESIKSIYRANGVLEETINSMFDGGDHWFNADKAVELGFSDKTFNASTKAKASAFAIAASADNIPEEVKNKLQSNIMKDEKSLMAKIGEFFNRSSKGEISLENAENEVNAIKAAYEQEKEAHNNEVKELQDKIAGFETEKENAVNEAKNALEAEKVELTNKVSKLEKDLADALAKIEDSKGEDNDPSKDRSRKEPLNEGQKAVLTALKSKKTA